MNKILQLWQFLDGKKTNIGAAILTAAFIFSQVNTQVVVGIWHVTPPSWFEPTIKTLEWIGSAFAGIGLTHKAVK